MRQFQGGDLFSAMAAERLDSMEETLDEIEEAIAALLRDDDEDDQLPHSPQRVASGGRLFVLLGGLAALLGMVPTLPVHNPVRRAVDYTISALVQQLPSDQPEVGSAVSGNSSSPRLPWHQAPYLPLNHVAAVQPPATGGATITPTPTPVITSAPQAPASVPGAAPPTPLPASSPQPAVGAPPAQPVLPAGGASLPPASVALTDPRPVPTVAISAPSPPAATPAPSSTPSPTPTPTPTPSPSPSP